MQGKGVLLGVTGSIAIYKAVDLASKLVQLGAPVDVVMTASATKMVSPITFQAIVHGRVATDMFDPTSELGMDHLALARRAAVAVVAPATANTMAKLALGLADDVLSTTFLAASCPHLVAPAMDSVMFQHPTTQENLARLKAQGWLVVGPDYGRLASGEVGPGRLAPLEKIIAAIRGALGRGGDLAGRQVVVTAGGTQEPIDPVRYIGNRSSGKMGFALAEAARDRGASVSLIAGPTSISPPPGMAVVMVTTALEMKEAVQKEAAGADVLIMAAAVADFRAEEIAAAKIKKAGEAVTLRLVLNPDILKEVRGDIVRVGFAAESEELEANAQKKLLEKRLDLIVANDITAPDSGFGSDTNRVVLIAPGREIERLPLLLKTQVAHRVLDRVVELLMRRVVGPAGIERP